MQRMTNISATHCPQAEFGVHEQFMDAARRELKEETGLDVKRFIIIHPGAYTSAGGTSERISLVLAIVDMSEAGGVHGHPDETEDLKSVIMKASDFIRAGHNGNLRDLSTLSAAAYLSAHRSKIRRDFTKAAQKKKSHESQPKERTSYKKLKHGK